MPHRSDAPHAAKSRPFVRRRARSTGSVQFGVQLPERMSMWTKWARQPQTIWLRRALFQIHLWIGLGLGLYIVMLSLTGSVLVYRNELDAWLRTPRPAFDAKATRLTADELKAVAERAYPGYTVTRLGDRITR